MSLEEVIARKYPPRKILDTDLQPQILQPYLSGPLYLKNGFILCEHCTNIIRANYASQHKSSGACQRNIQRAEKEQRC